MSKPQLSAKQQQWLNFLAELQIDVLYRPGKQNILPDALSWQPAPPTDVYPFSDASLTSMILEPIQLAKVYQGQ